MANRYWVGGTGTWDSSSTANWSGTSGGLGGASVPTSADDVYFDANSGGGVCTIGGASVDCNSLTTVGYTGSFYSSSFPRVTAWSGGINLGAQTWNSKIEIQVLGGTVIISPSATLGDSLILNSSQAAITLQSNINMTTFPGRVYITRGAYPFSFSGVTSLQGNNRVSLSASGGSLSLGSISTSCSTLELIAYSSGSISGSGSHSFSTLYIVGQVNVPLPSTINTLYNTGYGNGTPTLPSPLTIQRCIISAPFNTLTLNVPYAYSYTSCEFDILGYVAALNIGEPFPGFRLSSINTNAAVGVLSITPSISGSEVRLASDFRVNTLNINGPPDRVNIVSSTNGTRRRLTATSFSLADIAWRDIEAAGTIPFTGTNFADLGNNLNIDLPVAGGSGFFFGSNF